MCGIAGIVSLSGKPVPGLEASLDVMNSLLSHRGPDGSATWHHPGGQVGLMHRRLAIIDLTTGDQPMQEIRRLDHGQSRDLQLRRDPG